MSKFQVGDKVKILGNIRQTGLEGFIESIDMHDVDLPHYNIMDINRNIIASDISENILESLEINMFEKVMIDSYFMESEPYIEMATIVSQNGISIKVNQEVKQLNIAYFKVFNHIKFKSADKVARLHFKNSGIEIHESDPSGKKVWIPNSKDIKNIIKLLNKPYINIPKYTNWQVTCYQWNFENELIDQGIQDYFNGKYDHVYDNDSRLKEAYVPSTQEMPETWNL